jgi:hypothetical protein
VAAVDSDDPLDELDDDVVGSTDVELIDIALLDSDASVVPGVAGSDSSGHAQSRIEARQREDRTASLYFAKKWPRPELGAACGVGT